MKIKSYRKTIKRSAGLFAITDIVLNIFVFFFITFNLAGTLKSEMESHITDIDVPHESDEQPKDPLDRSPEPIIPLEVLIREINPITGELLVLLRDSSGQLRRVAFEKLTEEIEKQPLEEKEEQKVPSVIITTHQDIIYDYVIKVLDAVKAAKMEIMEKGEKVLVPKYKKIALTSVLNFQQGTQ